MGLKERFESKYIKSDDGCWLWQASTRAHGYGQFYNGETMESAHRTSYRLYKGEIPDGLNVLHECDNPKCVNPEHLFLGTQEDNMADKVAKNRQLRGSNVHQARLTEQDIVVIKKMLSDGIPHKDIAEKFNVTRSNISQINIGNRWSYVA